jgi:hypothetical protein
MRSDVRSVALGIALLLSLPGCSAVLAVTQYAERTTHPSIKGRASRTEVEGKLGRPLTTDAYADGSSTAAYEYSVYPPRSGFWGKPWDRAVQEALGGARVFYLTEVVLVPMEIGGKLYRLSKKERYRLVVGYGADDLLRWSERRRVTPGQDAPPE